jgi:tyrosyl-tRNA synthetase
MPSTSLKDEDFRDGKIDIVGVVVAAGLCPTRSEARRAVEQGGVTVNDEKVTDPKTLYDPDTFKGDGVIVRRGKKNYMKVVM